MTDMDHKTPVELTPALVGRKRELAILRARLKDGLMGRGAVVLTAGENGVGKTRLMDAAAESAQEDGMVFLRGSGTPDRTHLAYGVFLGVLRSYVERSSAQQRRQLQEVVTEFAPQLLPGLDLGPRPEESASQDADPQLLQRLFLAHVVHLLAELAWSHPVVICLEDLHWADSASLRLLRHLAQQNQEARLVILGTYRPQAVAPARAEGEIELDDLLEEFYHHPRFTLVQLARLSAAETRQLIRSCFQRCEFGEDLLQVLYHRSGGVPLFVVQYLEFLRAGGILFARHGVWLNQPLPVAVPRSLQGMLAERIGAVAEDQQKLLGYAALQGEVFDGIPVAWSMRLPPARVLRDLNRLQRTTHLVSVLDRGFRFAHPLLAEVCYGWLDEEEKRQGHLHLAEALETHRPAEVEALADHFFRAGVLDRACPYLVEAGLGARKGFAYREARSYLIKALAAMAGREQGSNRARKLQVLLALGEIEERLGRWDLASERCLEALRISDPQTDRPAAALAALHLGAVRCRKGEWQEGLQLYHQALETFTALQDEGAQALVHLRLGEMALERSRLQEAACNFREARAIGLRRHDDALLGEVSGNLGLLSRMKGQYLQAVLHYTEALWACRRAGDRYGMCRTVSRIGALHVAQEEWEEALACCAETTRLAREMGTVDLLAHGLVNQALAQMGAGDVDQAQGSCLAARAYLEEIRERSGLAECNRVQGMIYREMSRHAPAEESLRKGKQLFLDLGNQLGEAQCERELGLLLKQRGDVDGARQRLSASVAMFTGIGAKEEANQAERLLAALAA